MCIPHGWTACSLQLNSPAPPGASWAFTGKAWRRACRPPWKQPENRRVRGASCAASVSPELERVGPNVLPIHTKSRLPPGRSRKRCWWRKNPCDKSQGVSVLSLAVPLCPQHQEGRFHMKLTRRERKPTCTYV